MNIPSAQEIPVSSEDIDVVSCEIHIASLTQRNKLFILRLTWRINTLPIKNFNRLSILTARYQLTPWILNSTWLFPVALCDVKHHFNWSIIAGTGWTTRLIRCLYVRFVNHVVFWAANFYRLAFEIFKNFWTVVTLNGPNDWKDILEDLDD